MHTALLILSAVAVNALNSPRRMPGAASSVACNSHSRQQHQHQLLLPDYSHLDGLRALVLNADYQPLSYLPLSVWSWQESVKAVWQDRVNVVAVHSARVRSAKLSFDVPSVVVLKKFEKRSQGSPRFSKRLMLLRDDFTCQYCLRRFHAAELTCDHVNPRCSGGQSVWENAVTACIACNGKKKDLNPSQLRSVGMALARRPQQPTAYQLEAAARKFVYRSSIETPASRASVHASWEIYLAEILATTDAESPLAATAHSSD